SFHSGEGNNIIPDTAVIKGTVRTFDEEARTVIEEALKNVTQSTCAANGAGVDIEYIKDCPSIYNNPEETKRVMEVAKRLFSEQNVLTDSPMMGSEDFAYYTKEVPSVYLTVGGRNKEINAVYPHHHPKFNIDEQAILNIGK